MTHAEAREIVRRAWRRVHGREPSERELAYAQAIAYLETGYGRTGQFAAMAANGRFNWGALQRPRNADGACPAGSEPGIDLGPRCFLVFNSDEEAAAAFIRLLTTRHWPVIAAMRGTPEDVATAMRVPPPYYAGFSGSEQDRINAYANAIRNAMRATGQGGELPRAGISRPRLLVPALVAAAGLGLWYLYLTPAGRALRTRTERQVGNAIGNLLPL